MDRLLRNLQFQQAVGARSEVFLTDRCESKVPTMQEKAIPAARARPQMARMPPDYSRRVGTMEV